MAGRQGREYLKDEDFDEGVVWGVMEEKIRENSSSKLRKPFKNSSFFSPTSSVTTTATPRMIPRSSPSSSSEKQSSAPVKIPDWSKIYGKTIRKKKNGTISTSWVDNNNAVNHDYQANNGVYNHGNDHYLNGYYNNDDGDDDHGDVHHLHDSNDDDDDDMVPPHEFLARKLARSQISSFSVCEGIGRTLKGRDLSKVRNAILTKTGFLE